MFEGNILRPALDPAFGSATGQEPAPSRDGPLAGLQELSWSGLTARLQAMRDFRHVAHAGGCQDDHGRASFDAGSARWIAAHDPHGVGEDGINQDVSANRKWDAGNIVPATARTPDVRPASRGTA